MTTPIFIGGAPRSGLTLLRVILDAHSSISCGPDVGHVALSMTAADFEATLGGLHREHFFLEPATVRENFAQTIAAPMERRAQEHGKKRWADKTAFSILVFEQLAKLFPDAQFIHVVRDGRDLAASLIERRWRAPSGALFDQCASAAGAGRYWASIVSRGLAAESAAALAGRILRIRYEDIAAKPAETVQAICAYVGVAFEPAMLTIEDREAALAGMELETAGRLRRPINPGAVGRWRRDLRPADAAAIHSTYRRLFEVLGYEAR